jgi:hypothetical protein
MRSRASACSIGLIYASCQISDLPISCESLPLSTNAHIRAYVPQCHQVVPVIPI